MPLLYDHVCSQLLHWWRHHVWKWVKIFNRRNFVNIWARKPIISAERKACPWLSWLYLQIPVPLTGKKFALTPKWQQFLKSCSFQDSPNLNTYLETTTNIPAASHIFLLAIIWSMIMPQSQTRRKKWCPIHEIISKTHWAALMWSFPYMFLYKALVFQANVLDSSLQVAISRKRMI